MLGKYDGVQPEDARLMQTGDAVHAVDAQRARGSSTGRCRRPHGDDIAAASRPDRSSRGTGSRHTPTCRRVGMKFAIPTARAAGSTWRATRRTGRARRSSAAATSRSLTSQFMPQLEGVRSAAEGRDPFGRDCGCKPTARTRRATPNLGQIARDRASTKLLGSLAPGYSTAAAATRGRWHGVRGLESAVPEGEAGHAAHVGGPAHVRPVRSGAPAVRRRREGRVGACGVGGGTDDRLTELRRAARPAGCARGSSDRLMELRRAAAARREAGVR